jgi:hypothetical protein
MKTAEQRNQRRRRRRFAANSFRQRWVSGLAGAERDAFAVAPGRANAPVRSDILFGELPK